MYGVHLKKKKNQKKIYKNLLLKENKINSNLLMKNKKKEIF